MTPTDAILIDGTADASTHTRSYAATGFGDTEEVRINFVDATDEDFGIDNGIVTLPNDGDNVTFDGNHVTLSNVRVDGVLIAGASTTTDINVDGATEVTFNVTVANNQIEKRVPVVFEPDGADLPVDDDGAPEEAFGIGGQLNFADAFTVSFDADSQGRTVQADGSFTFEIALNQEYEGVTVDWIVSEDSTDTVRADVQADDNYANGSVTTDADGEASFTVSGPGEDGTFAVIITVDGFGDARANTTVMWDESAAAPEELAFSVASVFTQVGSTTTVTVEVLDQFGNAFAASDGEVISFDVGTTEDGTEVVDGEEVAVSSSGTASLSWVSGTNVQHFIAVSLLDDEGVPIEDSASDAIDLTAGDSAHVFFYSIADDEVNLSASGIVGFGTDDEWIVVDLADDSGGGDNVNAGHGDYGDFILFAYGANADAYQTGGGSASKSAFETALATTDDLAVIGADHDNAPTIYNFIP